MHGLMMVLHVYFLSRLYTIVYECDVATVGSFRRLDGDG
jgi:hypothetical protein